MNKVQIEIEVTRIRGRWVDGKFDDRADDMITSITVPIESVIAPDIWGVGDRVIVEV